MAQQPVGPVEALKLALKKEIEAAELYKDFALKHKAAADIFQFLVNEEEKHRGLIEKKIRELTL